MKAPVKSGQILAAKYRIDRILGEGAFGVVVAATHIQIGQRVALKFLQEDAAQQPGVVERFLREAQSAVQIQSEHVARVIDVGTLERGAPYMVMEFLQGRDLSQVLEAQGPLPLTTAIDYVLQACEAIAEAHKLGIVHRDLKPANLFLTARADGSPLVKVLDFGISKAPSSLHIGPAQSLTRTHGMMGSPLYMAPEQGKNAKRVDARADLWSIGVILYELTTRHWPFFGDNIAGLFGAIAAEPPRPMTSVWPACPPAFEAVILRCLEKDPARRFQSVAELAQALAPLAPASQLSVQRIVRLAELGASLPALPASPGALATAPTLPLTPHVPARTALLDSGERPTTVMPKPVVTSPEAYSIEAEALLAPQNPSLSRSVLGWGESTTAAPLPAGRRSWWLGLAGLGLLLIGGLGGLALSSSREEAPRPLSPVPGVASPLASGGPSAAVEAPPAATEAPPAPASSSVSPPASAEVPPSPSVAAPAPTRPPAKTVSGETRKRGSIPDWGTQH